MTVACHRHHELQRSARVIPCSYCVQQRHKIIRNGVALVGQESVSGSPAATGRGISQENPPMRIYVIGNDGVALCREPLATVTEGEIVVTSKEELQAAPLSGKRLLALWNALPGVEKRKKLEDRAAPDRPAVVGYRGAARPGTGTRREAAVETG